MDNKESFNLANKMMSSYVGLFIVFLIGIIFTLMNIVPLSDDLSVIKQTLIRIEVMQWVLLLLGLLLSSVIGFWWFKRGLFENRRYQEVLATLDAIYRSQAMIEFNMDGSIISANDGFLDALGYTLKEIIGKPHSIFVDSTYKTSQEYKDFWRKLNRGEYDRALYKRIKKNGQEIWLQSCYNPIIDAHGKPIKVIKVATDVTEQKLQEVKLAQLTHGLREIGKQILADSNDISVGINQLEATSLAQASSASEQASSIAEISATIEEIKTTTQKMLEKSTKLSESSARTNTESEKGQQAIETMNESMEILQTKMDQISKTILGLNDKTQQISEITETVSDIARQSKMLALNASIEAAKAGESGKGFAVVAGEVKELAEKSQLSTERVQKILLDIRQSAEQAVLVTENGTKSVEENIHQVKLTGDIIASLGAVIEESSLASLQIVSAIREESIAMEQIDLSIKQVDKVTGLLTSASEQTKDAIISLSKVCESLKKTANAYAE